MGQLVRQQALADLCSGRVLPCCENDMSAHRVGLRPDLTGRGPGSGIGMDADLTQVMAEARLHALTQAFRQCTRSGAERLGNTGVLTEAGVRG